MGVVFAAAAMLYGSGERVDLAHVSPFSLGTVRVQPSHRLISSGAESVVVEPRVMQLLVALAHAGGGILSRDDLIEQCWDGRIVGENAIQRAISHARKIAATIGAGSFEIETVRGVGYRLVDTGRRLEQRPAQVLSAGLQISRRAAISTVATGAAALVIGSALVRNGSESGREEVAEQFYRDGEMLLREEMAVTGRDAATKFKNAIRSSPTFSKAWGGLAVALYQQLSLADEQSATRIAGLSASAARRALELDPDLATAKAALVLIAPRLGNWDRIRGALTKLSGAHPDEWTIQRSLGSIAADVGDHAQGIAHFRVTLRAEPLLPRVRADLARALWGAGRTVEAEQIFSSAQATWPVNFIIWNSIFEHFAFSGHIAGAELQLSDSSKIPFGMPPEAIERRTKLVRALATGVESDVAAAIEEYISLARQVPRWTYLLAMLLASVGATDLLFEVLDGYFLGRGRYATKIGRFSSRPTAFLFLPPLRTVHSDRRFSALLAKIGLGPRA